MNVLIVTFLTGNSPSGVVTYYKALARDLREQGATVQVVETTDTPFVWNKGLNILGHVFRRLGRTSRIVWDESSYFVRLYLGARQHRNQPFDIIHAQDIRSGVAAYYALGKKVPVVLTAHFNDDPVTELNTGGQGKAMQPLSASLNKAVSRWYGWLFSQVKNYIFVSNYAYNQSKHLLPADLHKIILPNTVSLGSEAWTTRTGVTTEPLIISNVGYVDERKNQELLIRAGAVLKQRGFTNFKIWLIGDGPKRADYEQLVNELDLGEHVKFWGRQAEPWRLVAQSDLYVHTALNDNCPYAIVEAFAVRVPVLALPVGGIPELLPHGEGLLNGQTPAELADQLMPYRNGVQRRQLAQVQTQHAERQLSPELGLQRLQGFYEVCRNPNGALLAETETVTAL